MRKLLIKYLIGDYLWKYVQPPRAMMITFPLGLLWGGLTWFSSLWAWPVLAILLITLFISVIYFTEFAPVKYSELQDDEQKYWYGLAVKSGDLTKFVNDVDWDEWDRIKEQILKR